MLKIAFIVVVVLAILVNIVGWIAEKVYKKRMTENANPNNK